MAQFGVGSISENFDADKPFTTRGCIAQARSVAEVLGAILLFGVRVQDLPAELDSIRGLAHGGKPERHEEVRALRPTHLLSVGDEAPDFCLTATWAVNGRQKKRQVCLHDFRGKQAVIITFYGAAFTPV